MGDLTAAAALKGLLDAGVAALEALEREDEAGLAAALDLRDRLQEGAEPVLRALAARGEGAAELAEVRELASLALLCDDVLGRGLAARRDAVAAELRLLARRSGGLAGYAQAGAAGGTLSAVG
jgi:hypothetical protein